MASSPPPIKPKRREKYSKETTGCGLLVSVIKTLDASETNEQRQKEKLKIEKEFKKSDQLLNELVSKHDGDLTKVMQLFGKVSTHVTMSREKIHTVKENLHACKQLLRCRREELKKLWTDAVQQKYVLEMFDQINELRKVPSIVTAYTTKRQYLHATKALTSAIELGEGALREVEGLNDLRHDLEMRKNQLYAKLLEELAKYLYHVNTQEFLLGFQRQGSGRSSTYAASPFQRNPLRKSAERAESNSKVRRALFEMQQGGAFDVDKTEILEDGEMVDAELNSTYYIGIITECFALLNKVPQSLETIQVQMQSELGLIVTRTTQHIVALGPPLPTPEGQPAPPHPLIELLDLLFKQFKIVAETHSLLLKNYTHIIQRYKLSAKNYDIVDYWAQAQIVLQNVLVDYLNIDNPANDEQPRSTFLEQSTNLNTYFSRRKLPHKKTLFKFDKSSHTVSEGNEAKEHRRNLSDMSYDEATVFDPTHTSTDKKKRERVLVCKPDLSLIRTIYLPIMNYVFEIENIGKTGQRCSLHVFLAQHVKETFLARGHNRSLQMTIESLSKTQDAWKAIVGPDEVKRLGLNRPLLQSTVLVESRIRETSNLIQDLPNYSEDLLKMICALLKTYRETCQAAYRGIVQPETEDKRIYSVAWLKDDDISRFLKTLPNWTDLKMSHMRRQQFGKLAGNAYEMSEEESMVQVQQRNIREAEMLTSNLCEGGISQFEILSDVGVLKELAIMQQSMEWFSNRISEFASNLRKPIVNGVVSNELIAPVVVQDGTIKVLTNLALEFDELANTCLLVLHLEVRVQCFHYLRSYPSDRTKGDLHKGDNLEPDSKVLKLTKVLSDMDEAFSSTLHPRKVKYIFEGLAHLAARILIMASNSMESIDQVSVQRMCRNAQALQQTLSSITATREVALDHARNFYEMLYMKPEEILSQIVEKGAQFTEMQYLNALQLICKNRGVTDQNMLATYQQKLSDLLGPKPPLGVTV
ncbi:exocyst complex component 4 [Lutzomyia longipalpis]|uniref:exocyst complex component 4 n=1 Tax=Lutzomyia longipalpis TaxID=7200 RepID=UPI002483FBBD|nr:exocyst complex component 4 [Lutzomyia longipalpis]XP_055693527.1 exocyst complex component 4 [Lutzomyia longipalpis]